MNLTSVTKLTSVARLGVLHNTAADWPSAHCWWRCRSRESTLLAQVPCRLCETAALWRPQPAVLEQGQVSRRLLRGSCNSLCHPAQWWSEALLDIQTGRSATRQNARGPAAVVQISSEFILVGCRLQSQVSCTKTQVGLECGHIQLPYVLSSLPPSALAVLLEQYTLHSQPSCQVASHCVDENSTSCMHCGCLHKL